LKRTVSRPASSGKADADAGFTLTELVAGLLVASMLIVGIADITRRYALTTARVKEAAAEVRTALLVQSLLADLERADPDSIEISADHLSAAVGQEKIEAKLVRTGKATEHLEWTSPRISRSIRLPAGARLETNDTGAIILRAGPDAPPLAMVLPRRSIPFNCKFDTLVRKCR
jgi:hypothetical protein